MTRQLVTFDSGGFTLVGYWDLPAGEPPYPAVMCCHGFTGHNIEARRLYARLARLLRAQGIACFRFDHRGCGNSDGDFVDFTPSGFLQDLDVAAEHWLADRRIDTRRLGIVGYSLGGLAAAYLLHSHPNLRTGVLWAGVARPEIIRDRLAQYPGFRGYRERGFMDYGGLRVSCQYIDEIGTRTRPVEWLAGYQGPVLFCHGAQDDIVRLEQSECFVRARKNPSDRLLVFPEADHGFSTCETIDALLRVTLQWLLGKL